MQKQIEDIMTFARIQTDFMNSNVCRITDAVKDIKKTLKK